MAENDVTESAVRVLITAINRETGKVVFVGLAPDTVSDDCTDRALT